MLTHHNTHNAVKFKIGKSTISIFAWRNIPLKQRFVPLPLYYSTVNRGTFLCQMMNWSYADCGEDTSLGSWDLHKTHAIFGWSWDVWCSWIVQLDNWNLVACHTHLVKSLPLVSNWRSKSGYDAEVEEDVVLLIWDQAERWINKHEREIAYLAR